MKNFTLTPLLIILATLVFNSANAQCPPDQSDEDWHIGSSYGSHRITSCWHNLAYNCNGFVLSYFENECTPGIYSYFPRPYICPEDQGDLDNGFIISNVRIVEVCNVSQCDIVTYDISPSAGLHSSVKVTEGPTTKYISKYGMDGPLVSHDLEGSFYHYYYPLVTIDGYWVYIGKIMGNPNISGTGNVTFSVNNKPSVTYAWSIISGGANIYISSGSSQSSVTLTPLHSGPCSS